MSADDLEKGTRWRSGIATELEKSSVGIICLTRENLDSTWIHFEAGALSKQQQDTYVCTFLFGLEPTDVREPLAQFQATRARKDDVRKLVFTINNTLADAKLPESELSEAFEVWWPKLEERINRAGEIEATTQPVRTDRELLEEVLNIVRDQKAAAEYLTSPKMFERYLDKNFPEAGLLSTSYQLDKALERFGRGRYKGSTNFLRRLAEIDREEARSEKDNIEETPPDENPNP